MFIFGNKSSDEMGLKCVLYTLRKKARQISNKYTVTGRPEPFIDIENAFDTVRIDVECDLMDEADLDEIFSWLSGKGILIDETHPDKYRIATVSEEINTIPINDDMRTIRIPFICSAFMYAVDNEPFTIPGYGGYPISIKGSYYSEPKIILKIHPSGYDSFTLKVNNKDFIINTIAEDENHNIVVDSEKNLVYYEDTGEIILNRTTGDFPLLDYETTNPIDWYPLIAERVKVVKNERWK